MPDDNFILARKRDNLQLRARVIQNIRFFFIKNKFLEVETPIRIPAPAPEEHIQALSAGGWFLQTSPELCMKRLLAAGYPRIFQIEKCFRAEERGSLHLPEFTMLEWYEAGFDYHQLMDQCEEMLRSIVINSGLDSTITRQCTQINLAEPWERITVRAAFKKYAPLSMEDAMDQDKFDETMVEFIEPRLGKDKPAFIYDYPAPVAALAKLKDTDSSVAERFELYMGGLELANGFSELTNAAEQRQRFEEALEVRAQKGWSTYPLPEKFLAALTNLPACAGIALGIDRLVMLFAGAAGIDDVIAFPPESL